MFDWTESSRNAVRQTAREGGATAGAAVVSGYGLITGTHVATDLGWQRVETLRLGARVRTVDHEMRVIVAVERRVLWEQATHIPEHMCPVVVPPDTLGNRCALYLLPEQGVRMPVGPAGGRDVIIPAGALLAFGGVRRTLPRHGIDVFTLVLDKPAIIRIDGAHRVTQQAEPRRRPARAAARQAGRTEQHTEDARQRAGRPSHGDIVAGWRREAKRAPAFVA